MKIFPRKFIIVLVVQLNKKFICLMLFMKNIEFSLCIVMCIMLNILVFPFLRLKILLRKIYSTLFVPMLLIIVIIVNIIKLV